MEKIKSFMKKYSAEILIVFSAITAILNTLATHEGANAVLISILIAIVAIIVEIFKNGVTKNALDMIVNLAALLLSELGDIEIKDDKVVAITADGEEKSITFEEIKNRLLEK